jgi:hypothetical protein
MSVLGGSSEVPWTSASVVLAMTYKSVHAYLAAILASPWVSSLSTTT